MEITKKMSYISLLETILRLGKPEVVLTHMSHRVSIADTYYWNTRGHSIINLEETMSWWKEFARGPAWAIVLALCVPAALMAESDLDWISLDGAPTVSAPEVRLLESNGLRTVMEVTIPGFYQQTIIHEGVIYQKLTVLDNLAGKVVGHPDLPVLSYALGLPSTGTLTARISYLEGESFSGYMIYPFLQPETDKRGEPQFVIDQAVYQQNRLLPENMVTPDGPHIWRDIRLVSVQLTPFQYNPATGHLDAYRKVRIEVTATPGAGVNPLEGDHSRVTPMFDRMYRAAILNYDDLGYQVTLTDDPAIKYLIITNTGALTSIQPLVDFRDAQGYHVEVRTIQSPAFDEPLEFKTYIRSLYLSGGLEYVLLVGDAGTGDHNVPLYWWNPDGSDGSYSDSWYSCLVPGDDNDHYAEIAIGRIVYDNTTELQHQITKLIGYLRTPDTSTNWAEHSLLVAHQEEYPLKYTLCKNEIDAYNYPIQNAIFDSVYGGNGGTNQQVVNYINNTGCGILNYRGHGSDTEWWQWGPSGSLTAVHLAQMTNANRLFVHFDVCCDNMNIITYPGDCLAESFMKEDYCAVAINGAIIPSYTIPNHDYDKEMYKAVYEEGINNIGYVTNFANITVLNVHGSLGRSNARTYLWLGDASIDVWTNTPRTMAVTHLPIHYVGLPTYDVTVLVSGSPLQDAMVCASNDEVYAVGWTDATGHVTLTFEAAPVIPADMSLMVTAHNCLPYEATVSIIPPAGPYVIYDSHTLNDASGNNDGLADYGEHILTTLTVENVGVDPATDVTVTLSSDDENITFTDDEEFAGTIAAGSTVTLTNAFAFDVSPDAPDEHYVTIGVTAQDSTDLQWVTNFGIELHAPVISIQSLVVDDAVGGNGNGKLDPGELGDVTVTLANGGSSDASNITAVLTTDQQYTFVNQGTATLASLVSSGSGTLTPDYGLQLAHASPDPSLAILYLELTGNNELHKYLMYELSLGGFFDDIEAGQGSWTHTFVTPTFTDQWHISTEDFSSASHSWKCGDTGTGTYANRLDAALTMPSLTLPAGCSLQFDHRIQAETSSYYPDSAYDGGIVEISVAGGAWTLLIPEGGYNKTIRYTSGGGNPYTGPFPGGTPCFSGDISWTQETVDLSSYSGNVQIRFRFGSDNGTALEGWYVDDVNIVLQSSVSPPTDLEAGIMGTMVDLTWTSPGASGMIASLLSYNIYRQGIKVDSMVYANHYQDDLTGLPNGTYTYHVSAVFDQGESAMSNPATVFLGVLGTVQNLTIMRLGPNVYFMWSMVPGATHYRVYRSTEPDTGFSLIGTALGPAYYDPNVVGPHYFYYVTAADD